MQKSYTDGVRIHAKIQQNVCNGKRMDDIWLSGRARLSGVCAICQLIGGENLAEIILLICGKNLFGQF